MYSGTTVLRLLRWARWKMQSGVNLGYKPQVNFMRLSPSTSSTWDSLVDRECIETDMAFCQLPELDKLIIRIEYLSTANTDNEKSFAFGASVRTYRHYKKVAHIKLERIIKDQQLLQSSHQDDIKRLE